MKKQSGRLGYLGVIYYPFLWGLLYPIVGILLQQPVLMEGNKLCFCGPPENPDGGFKYFLFSSLLGEMIKFD